MRTKSLDREVPAARRATAGLQQSSAAALQTNQDVLCSRQHGDSTAGASATTHASLHLVFSGVGVELALRRTAARAAWPRASRQEQRCARPSSARRVQGNAGAASLARARFALRRALRPARGPGLAGTGAETMEAAATESRRMGDADMLVHPQCNEGLESFSYVRR